MECEYHGSEWNIKEDALVFLTDSDRMNIDLEKSLKEFLENTYDKIKPVE